jgi:hypothetical protein
MANDKTTFQTITETLDDMGIEYRSYSGRGMYGAECLGIDVDHGSNFTVASVAAKLVLELMAAGERTAAETVALADIRTDSMGLGAIVYFQDIKWERSTSHPVSEEEDDDTACGQNI